MSKYVVIYEPPAPGPDGAGNWGAYVPDLPGLFAVGGTREECEALMTTAIPFHIEGLRRHGEPVPAPSVVAGVLEVAA
jgi:predicted RNase H-like HicB family nuclease